MKITDRIHAFPWESMAANNCNTYFINGSEKIVIDPGHIGYFDRISKELLGMNVKVGDVDTVICTHVHPDHMEAAVLLKQAGAKFAMHQEDWQLAKSWEPMLKQKGVDINEFSPDFFLNEGELTIKDMTFEIYHTPGHSPGSICIYWAEEEALFTGDVIFKDGLGRTDLPGGNSGQLKESINRLSEIPARYLFSGHGDLIKTREEVIENFNQVKGVWFNYL